MSMASMASPWPSRRCSQDGGVVALVHIVHTGRNSVNYVSWKRREDVAADLRRIYAAETLEEFELVLGEFEEKWDQESRPIGRSWRTGAGVGRQQYEPWADLLQVNALRWAVCSLVTKI